MNSLLLFILHFKNKFKTLSSPQHFSFRPLLTKILNRFERIKTYFKFQSRLFFYKYLSVLHHISLIIDSLGLSGYGARANRLWAYSVQVRILWVPMDVISLSFLRTSKIFSNLCVLSVLCCTVGAILSYIRSRL